MLQFVIRRVISGIILVAVVSSATFFLAHLAIGDPTIGLLGSSATQDQMASLAAKIGTDRPLIVQFFDWAGHAITGDLGDSWRNFQSVSSQIGLKLPVTLSIVTFAILLTAVFGALLGIATGLRPGTLVDRALQWLSVILFALPGFWVALVLVITFAVNLKWFPAVGYVQPGASLSGWLRSLALPGISLALGAVVMVASQLRNALVETSQLDYVRTLRSRGLSNGRVTLHMVRNAAPTSLTVLALMFVGLLGGAVVVEQIFALPGIGALTTASSQNGDIPILLGITVVTVAFVVVVNLVLDLLLGWINPKARQS